MSERDLLREAVCEACKALPRHGLSVLTWGNVSGITSDRSCIAIKPSGVAYEALTPRDIVLLEPCGRIIEGALKPSTDFPTHAALYAAFDWVHGVTHTHSPHACMFAQARVPVPCLGTTHADHFAGEVPVTRQLTIDEVASAYEASTGKVIIETFATRNAHAIPGVLVAGHAPFTWGGSPAASLHNAIALEEIARIAHGTLALNTGALLEHHVLAKHYARKHGPAAYYGQDGRTH